MFEKRRKQREMTAFTEGVKTLEGVAFIGGIGAGILSLPFAVAQVGLFVGLPYIALVGLLMMGINLLLGEIVIRTKKNMQLAGLARTYLGRGAEGIMVLLSYTLLFGALLIYIIGEGQTLSTLFGGNALNWSLAFFVGASTLVLLGMKMVKRIDIILLFILTFIISLIIAQGFVHIDPTALVYTNWQNIFLPYGVLVFAFHASTSVPEAYEVVDKNPRILRKVIIASTFYNILIYSFFAIATVGVMGMGTTAIATIGLGEKIGQQVLVFGNVFAAVAMGLAFLNVASSLRDSLRWDFNFPPLVGAGIACLIPFLLFLAGVRQFIELIDVVGGVVMSIEMLLLLLIYWKIKHKPRSRKDYMLHHGLLVFSALIIAFSFGTVYSVIKFF